MKNYDNKLKKYLLPLFVVSGQTYLEILGSSLHFHLQFYSEVHKIYSLLACWAYNCNQKSEMYLLTRIHI